jgi:hypothetical protein
MVERDEIKEIRHLEDSDSYLIILAGEERCGHPILVSKELGINPRIHGILKSSIPWKYVAYERQGSTDIVVLLETGLGPGSLAYNPSPDKRPGFRYSEPERQNQAGR